MVEFEQALSPRNSSVSPLETVSVILRKGTSIDQQYR